jgi:hypothetical protein
VKRSKIAAQEDGFCGFTELRECPVDGMLHIRTGESAQNVLGLRGSQLQGGRVLDHGVIVLGDQIPIDGPGENRREAGVGRRVCWPIEPLRVNAFEAGVVCHIN